MTTIPREKLDRTTLLLGSNMKISYFIDWIEISFVSWRTQLTKAGNSILNNVYWADIINRGGTSLWDQSASLNVESQSPYNYWDTPNVRVANLPLLYLYLGSTKIIQEILDIFKLLPQFVIVVLHALNRPTYLISYLVQFLYGYDDQWSCIMYNIMLKGEVNKHTATILDRPLTIYWSNFKQWLKT